MSRADRSIGRLLGARLAVAARPIGNPQDLDSLRYTLPLLGHDYPALTPAMWNACYARYGMAVRNVAVVCRPDDLGEVLEALRADARYVGGGVGVGLKAEVTAQLDHTDPMAATAGAVNLIRRTPNGELTGFNTDGEGYARSLEETLQADGRPVAGLRVVMLGAGGTGRAVALALARRGAEVVVLNRSVERAASLTAEVNAAIGRALCTPGGEERLDDEAPRADVVINVSTKGATGPLERHTALAPAPLPVTPESVERNRASSRRILAALPRSAIVSDVVLRNGPTPTLALARELGFTTLDGVGMVVHQAVGAFRLLHEGELQQRGITDRELATVMQEAVPRGA